MGKSGGLSEKELHAAEDDDFLQGLFQKYASNGKNGIKVVTKDKAYICAQKYIEKWRHLTGAENQAYLKENFQSAWEEHDVHNKNKIDITEAYSMLKEL